MQAPLFRYAGFYTQRMCNVQAPEYADPNVDVGCKRLSFVIKSLLFLSYGRLEAKWNRLQDFLHVLLFFFFFEAIWISRRKNKEIAVLSQ